jgi:hypothetical protein
MNTKYIAYGFLSFFIIFGWNLFLIQRDDALYKAYDEQQTIQQQK